MKSISFPDYIAKENTVLFASRPDVKTPAGGWVSLRIVERFGGDDASPTSASITLTMENWDQLVVAMDRKS